MTDLEIIKKELNQIPDGYESVNQCKATYEILKAAERMAAEIEWVRKENEQIRSVAHDFEIGFDEAQKEIDRLKAELEEGR